MKIIKLRVSSLLSRLCAAALVLLGYGCSSNGGDEPCMYGTPTGTFEVKGTVVDENGNPVDGADIIITEPHFPSSTEYPDGKGKSDASGNFKINGEGISGSPKKVVCKPNNENLEADSTLVKVVYDKTQSTGSWDSGHAELNVDFTLKEKKAAE
ncbi:MAG: radical SAM-associated putative lipoprotein [Muribaculaceae bacterium]